ncbi:MAG: twin-arginine translocation signal domain-containing protein, partial [Verrucomicrobia bacterium]|nr:twin-arginine translocation signal domain-containing protein [Verrucomicrobiota bacterium]
MKRREFLKASGGAALLGLLGALPASVTPVS